jgi:hypothetical protein
MPKFLISVPHDPDTLACAKVVKVFLATGSHLLANADWGCMDGDHCAYMFVDVANKDEARGIVPPAFRKNAHVVRMTRFRMADIEETIRRHSKPAPSSG